MLQYFLFCLFPKRDMIKGNESDNADIVFEILANGVQNPCFTLFRVLIIIAHNSVTGYPILIGFPYK